MLGTAINVHASQTNANGTGRDDDDSVAFLAKLDSGIDNQGQDRQERLMSLFVDNRTSACDGCVSKGGRIRDTEIDQLQR